MKKTTINIQHEANIKAEGKRSCHRCKPIICIETGDVFSSVLDAAEKIGCSEQNVSAHLCGRTRSVKGKHYCYLSRVTESLDSIITRLRETAAIEEDAKKWQAHQAEQEIARKAAEKRQAEIAKLQEKRNDLNAKCSQCEAQWHGFINELAEVEMALEALGVTIEDDDAA